MIAPFAIVLGVAIAIGMAIAMDLHGRDRSPLARPETLAVSVVLR